MIKRLIGILVAVAVIAVIVIVFLRRDKFESMIRRDELPAVPAPVAPAPVVPTPMQPAIPAADSLTVGVADSI
ncbi:hypothetical protein [Alistipes provencensis]|uniref:hypothetical protein n=1 Tax=Alistipes provencensis TaxID=1816676 RepID=UPI0007ED3986|nr:hypothetical protein [Alistipes provencensis]